MAISEWFGNHWIRDVFMSDSKAKRAVTPGGVALTVAQVVSGLFGFGFALTAISAALGREWWPGFTVCILGFVVCSVLSTLFIRLDARRWNK